MPFAVLLASMLVVMPSHALRLKFTNHNNDFADSQVYVMFRTGSPQPFRAYLNGVPVALTTAYSFAELSPGVVLSNITSGKLYISLGKSMSVPITNVAGNLPEPSPSNPVDTDYSTRWDSVEITFNGLAYDAANLTGINLFGIPFSLRTFFGTTNRVTFGYNVDGLTMISNLTAAALNGNAVLHDGSGPFLRVLGPTAYAYGTVGPYRWLGAYVDAVRNAGRPIAISDHYDGRAGSEPNVQAQRYAFIAFFTNITSTNYLCMTGGSETPGGIGMGHIIKIAETNVAYHIYANDPHYYIDNAAEPSGSMADNDVYAAAVRDVFAGFAAGFIGSTATNQVTGMPFLAEASSNWFGAGQTQAFSDVQTELPYYIAYGEVFWRCSDVYGFPFADRLRGQVLANLDPATVDTLEIIVLPDAIPEPGAALVLVFLMLVHTRCRYLALQ